MTDAEHVERLRNIEAETEEIRRQIMQFEFQHKKDVADAEKQFKARADRMQRQLDHLIKLVGITYDELDQIDSTLTATGVVLTRPRRRATL